MSVNLLKTGAWALIGGTVSTAIFTYGYHQYQREVRESRRESGGNRHNYDLLPGGSLHIFVMGAIVGVAFKIIGIPAIQFLASGTLQMGRTIVNQRERAYNSIKWLFTK